MGHQRINIIRLLTTKWRVPSFLVDGNDFAEKHWNYWRISLIIQVPVQQTYNALPRPLSNELEQYIEGLLKKKLIFNLYHECPTNISTPITSGSTMQKKR